MLKPHIRFGIGNCFLTQAYNLLAPSDLWMLQVPTKKNVDPTEYKFAAKNWKKIWNTLQKNTNLLKTESPIPDVPRMFAQKWEEQNSDLREAILVE